jgi:hypothetical protein
MAGRYAPDVTNLATVKSVDESECTCVLTDEDGQEFYDVRLRPVTGANKSLLQIPKVGSFVLAVRVESSEDWMVIACDEVDKIQLIAGDSTIVITGNDILINGGALGGLIKISELTTALNQLVNTFNTHTHAVAGSTASPTPNQAAVFNQSAYEDDAIKH